MKTSEATREYQRKYYQEKVKKRSEKKQEISFQIQKNINGTWVTVCQVLKKPSMDKPEE